MQILSLLLFGIVIAIIITIIIIVMYRTRSSLGSSFLTVQYSATRNTHVMTVPKTNTAILHCTRKNMLSRDKAPLNKAPGDKLILIYIELLRETQ